MSEEFRIPVDDEYLNVLGRAVYNFAYLEKVVIDCIVILNSDGHNCIPKNATAGQIATAFLNTIEEASSELPKPLLTKFRNFYNRFCKAIRKRNELLHANPITDADGNQTLNDGGDDYTWKLEYVLQAAHCFEEIALSGGKIYHDKLKKIYPELEPSQTRYGTETGSE